jgi:16S rRNA (guanine1207-N2)-methyltransferase
MHDLASATLARPFETGVLEWPKGPVLILNARPNMGVPQDLARISVAIQPERGLFNALKAEGFITHAVMPEIAQPEIPTQFAAAFILVARQRAENDLMLAQANKHVAPGGVIVVAGAKNSGVEALAKAIAKSGADIGKLSKNHALVFWANAPLPEVETIEAKTAEDFATPTGGFSTGFIDQGSKFLIENLPPKLWGSIADFGAAWGYLSAEIAARCPKVSTLTLIESRFEALEAAKQNLANITIPATFHWLDVTAEKLPGLHDWVVMNPPFHDALGNHAPELGQAFIKAAFKSLKPNGQLLMVANKQLPYEKTLATGFRGFQTLAENGRFKVILARK